MSSMFGEETNDWGASVFGAMTHVTVKKGAMHRKMWNQSKFNNTSTNQDNSILFEDFKSVETHTWVGV